VPFLVDWWGILRSPRMLFSTNFYHREWLTEQFGEACCGSPATVPSKELHLKSARADRYHHLACHPERSRRRHPYQRVGVRSEHDEHDGISSVHATTTEVARRCGPGQLRHMHHLDVGEAPTFSAACALKKVAAASHS
jgi:hypothetical protein